jgi:transposase-like protein
MLERGGEVLIRMLENVQRGTIKPIIERYASKGSLIMSDEYTIYDRLVTWGYAHKRVCHGAGEFARDDDGDGVSEVHVNTIEGFWSLPRSWLRPHRGISQENLPAYLGFFEFVHNTGARGRALLPSMLELLLCPWTHIEPKFIGEAGQGISVKTSEIELVQEWRSINFWTS